MGRVARRKMGDRERRMMGPKLNFIVIVIRFFFDLVVIASCDCGGWRSKKGRLGGWSSWIYIC